MTEPSNNTRRTVALAFAAIIGSSGVLGMLASFFFLSASNELDLMAGQAGLIGGAVLVAGSVIGVAILARD